jgi:hypothetical protein
MGFMQSTTNDGEDFKVYVAFNAKAGRWYTKEDKPEAELFEVKDMTAVFDFASLKTGWFLFAPGVAPVKQLEPSLNSCTPRPSDGFKKGFQLNLFSNKNLLGVREFASTAGAVIDSMNELYDLYIAAPEAKEGKLPVVKCMDVKPIVGKHGTNYSPILQIISWVDRPPELVEAAPQKPQADHGAYAREAAPTGYDVPDGQGFKHSDAPRNLPLQASCPAYGGAKALPRLG